MARGLQHGYGQTAMVRVIRETSNERSEERDEECALICCSVGENIMVGTILIMDYT